MPYNPQLAQRLRQQLAGTPGLSERKMFGGVAFMIHGHLATGVLGDEIIVRVGKEAYGEWVMHPHTRLFDMTGREMRGWVVVKPEGIADDDDLAHWAGLGVAFVQTLPPKG